ncbi:L,D-transpeptidase family protein [Corallococcus aberystwythensis]|uniref:Murein L,D-transpeptidase n=1 Tax=Corallococcus aberystwythensis TaxID=2316722 RepID=A0A3A8QDZ2_9BACT|nr:L,D-transpeptidase family protein [Corallococcus aberystwythensis]RKH66847.1 murein L,D-transpeptidase [Corallococcus aberystwythensis]
MRRRWFPLGLPLILFACAPVEPPVPVAPVDAGTVTAQAAVPAPEAAPAESAQALHSAWQATAPEPSDDGGVVHATAPALLGAVDLPEDAGSSLSLEPSLSQSASAGANTEALPGEEEPQVITESEVPVLELGPDGEPLIDTDDSASDDAIARNLDGGSAPASPGIAVGSDPNAPVANAGTETGPEPATTPIMGTDGDEDVVAEAPLTDVDAGMEPYAIPYAPDAGSLRVRRSIAVRSEPRQDSPSLGTVAQDMRVTWQGAMRGPDCDTWVQLQPRGWVCERYLEQNFREPRVRPLPRVEEGALTPGIYARVVGHRVRAYPSLALARRKRQGVLLKGSVTVKLLGQVKVGRRTFWRTSDGQYFEARVLREHRPSDFSGLDAEALASLPMPFAWAQSRAAPRTDVMVRKAPDARAERETVLPPRTLVSVRELSPDGQWVRIAEDHWVARDDLHVAWPLASPSIVEPGARWLDVDLEAQTLIAYEGDRPVYATLISSGKPGTDTPEGLFRIWVKFAEADMTGTMGSASYRVATVPWTMFFEGDFALHTAYWHDRFGEPVSHGCINLAPKDARALYGWTTPEVPTGWSMVHAMPDDPGTWVRIRGQAHEAPKKRRKSAPVVATVRDL